LRPYWQPTRFLEACPRSTCRLWPRAAVGWNSGLEIFSARRGPLTTATVEEGEVLGWFWFDKPFHWHLDARARRVTRAVALDVGALRSKCEEDHDLGYEFMKRYAQHLAVQFRVTKLQLVDMYGT